MRMEAELDAVLNRQLAQFVQPVTQAIQLFLGGCRMVAQQRNILRIGASGNLGNMNVLTLQNRQIDQMLQKALLIVLKIALT